jgi:hypothetical protein
MEFDMQSKHTRKVSGVLAFVTACAMLCSAAQGWAWEITRDFNSGRPGTVAQAHPSSDRETRDAFDDGARGSIYDDTVSYEGGQSAQLNIEKGDHGFGRWGGIIYFPRDVSAMSDFWYQMYIFIPEDFAILDSNGSLKWIRFHGRKSDGSNGGYLDIQLHDDGRRGDAAFRMYREGDDTTGWFLMGSRKSFPKGQWHRITVRLFTDTKTVAEGGRSYVKLWLNGELAHYEPRLRTLPTPGEVLDCLYLFTYWNGEAPKTQRLWVDKIQMSTEFPSWAEDLPYLDDVPQTSASYE